MTETRERRGYRDDRDAFFDQAVEDPRFDLSVAIGTLTLKNPVMPASGCFGPELGSLVPLHELGALVTKTVFSSVRSGNPSHRLTEAPRGMLNSVGIPSPGAEGFRRDVLPRYNAAGVPVIVSVGGLTIQEYWTITEELRDDEYAGIEVNVSCPNLEKGGLEIGTDPPTIERVVRGVVERTDRPVLVKLTPSVTSIASIAAAAEAGGAAALTVANTFPGMAVDTRRRRAVLGATSGGLSGPAVRPMALRLVYLVAKAVQIPVVGCGGICTARDVVEFAMAGATAVQVGTANFTRPFVMAEIVRDLPRELERLGFMKLVDLIGSLEHDPMP